MILKIHRANAWRNKKILSWFLKSETEAELRMAVGKLFQRQGAATENERSPSVVSVFIGGRWRRSSWLFLRLYLQSWTKVLGHLHFFAENRPSSISPSPLPLSMLYQWAESALFRSNIDQGGGGTSLCANATLQSVENRAIIEHVSYFQAVPRTFVQDCLNSLCGRKTTITPTGFNVLRLNLDSKVFETLCTYSIHI